MNLLLLTVIAHLAGDFLFQSRNIVENKEKMKLRGYFSHGLVLFVLTFLLTVVYGLIISLSLALLLGLVHIVVDFIKVKLAKIFTSAAGDLYIFIGDQILHLAVIYFIWLHFFRYPFSEVVFRGDRFLYQFGFRDTFISEILIFVVVYLLVLFVGAVFLEKVLNLIDLPADEKEQQLHLGKYIGVVERALVLTLILTGSMSSIGIIFMAKSLARFNKLNQKMFAEYYLLGTLTSILIAVLGGFLLQNLL